MVTAARAPRRRKVTASLVAPGLADAELLNELVTRGVARTSMRLQMLAASFEEGLIDLDDVAALAGLP